MCQFKTFGFVSRSRNKIIAGVGYFKGDNLFFFINCISVSLSKCGICRLHHHHHHHVVLLARISLTLSRHFSLSFITSGWSSELHPVSSHSCCMHVLAGRPAFARSYVGVHRSTSVILIMLLIVNMQSIALMDLE